MNNENQDLESNTSLPDLSANSMHPWDKLKVDIFGKDYIPSVIDDVILPESFSVSDSISSIENIKKDHYDKILSSLESSNVNLNAIYEAPFLDNSQKYDVNIHKKYIDLVEMINSITEEHLQNSDNVEELNKKIIFKYLDTFNN